MKKFYPQFPQLYEKAVESMGFRPKDPRRESAEQIMDVYPSREIQKDGPIHSFRGRISGDKRGRLSRKEWEARMLAKDREQLKKGGGL